MTEDEAKTKWCFHFIASHTNPRQREWRDDDHKPGTGSGEPTGPFQHHCIGSACMAWRAGEDEFHSYTDRLGGEFVKTGFCGLAGQPS